MYCDLVQAPCLKQQTSVSSLVPQVGRLENAIGWYHSHPGYGCWLSGIDVSTQMLNQQFQEPFVAVVVRQETVTLVISSQTHVVCAVTFQPSPIKDVFRK